MTKSALASDAWRKLPSNYAVAGHEDIEKCYLLLKLYFPQTVQNMCEDDIDGYTASLHENFDVVYEQSVNFEHGGGSWALCCDPTVELDHQSGEYYFLLQLMSESGDLPEDGSSGIVARNFIKEIVAKLKTMGCDLELRNIACSVKIQTYKEAPFVFKDLYD